MLCVLEHLLTNPSYIIYHEERESLSLIKLPHHVHAKITRSNLFLVVHVQLKVWQNC